MPHALFTAVLQIRPWFRRRYPVAHRRLGRVYIFGGVFPATVAALTIGAFSPYGPGHPGQQHPAGHRVTTGDGGRRVPV